MSKKVSALALWRKMLGMLFETGHPWITFKDPCNLRSPQQHCGVVHSSNLCTEITLNTSEDEIAVCNLGSINLPAHLKEGKIDSKKLRKTVHTAVRMLDNVIDINYYSVPQARKSNLRHRPIGLGVMGFQDALYVQKMPYDSAEAIEFADKSMEEISYYAIEASSKLAEARGSYETFEGSLWSKGILPIDSINLLQHARGGQYLEQDRAQTMDWNSLRSKVRTKGMRNSNVMAIAPTATIANITGVSQSIEPTYQNLYVKSNLSGEFTVINPYLVDDLKALKLWDEVMVNDLKYFNGSVQQIDRIPANLKRLYATAFEIDASWLIEAASRRQKWIDQAQSLNLYIAKPSGKVLDNIYKLAWQRGLKTTYYLRSLGATNTEKSTVDRGGELNAVKMQPEAEPKVCSITDPDCEACQ
jgi:ribonucleoside-diphosphate reductase alpha chain